MVKPEQFENRLNIKYRIGDKNYVVHKERLNRVFGEPEHVTQTSLPVKKQKTREQLGVHRVQD